MKKNINNFSWILIGNIIVSFSKWGMVILIAQFLSVEDVGTYSLVFAITAPISLFSNMKLRSLYITSTEDDFTSYQYVRIIFSLFAIAAIFILGLFIYSSILPLLLLVGMNKILDLHSDLYYSLPNKFNNLILVGKILIFKSVILLFVFTISLLLTKDLKTALVFQLIFQLFILMFEKKIIEKKYYSTYVKFNGESLKSIIKLGIPLGIVQMLISFNANFPRYALEYFSDKETLGYFSAIMYVAIIANLFMNAISQIFLPKLSFLYKENKIIEFKKYVYRYLVTISLILGVILFCAIAYFGELLLTIIYGEAYAAYNNTLLIITISIIINLIAWNFDTALMAIRYVSIQPKITLVNCLFTIVISIFLIKYFGIEGASYTLIITATIQLFLSSYFLNKRLNFLK